MQDSDNTKTAGSAPTSPTFHTEFAPQTSDDEESVEDRIARLSTVRDIATLHKHTKYQDLPPAPSGRLEEVAAEPGFVAEVELSVVEKLDDFLAQSLQRIGLVLSFIRYSWKAFLAWWRSFFFSPFTLFTDPTNTAGSILIYPVVFFFLAASVFAFYLGSWLHIDRIVENISKKQKDNLSIINWPNPSLFSSPEATETVKSANATLSGVSTTFPDAPAPGKPAPGEVAARDLGAGKGLDLKTTRVFDLDVAKAFLLMSALVYEVRDYQVREAKTAKQSNEAQKFLLDSEDFIKSQAHSWGLRYLPMSGFKDNSDLGSKAGPFAGVFFTPRGAKEPFIVLCFKGTTPSNFTEFLVDASISRVSSASFFGDGTAHEGFMRELFPIGHGRSDDYGQITRGLRILARELSEKASAEGEERKPVPLWITGHSLGAALAGLSYARYLHKPKDLGSNIVLRDAYTFGAPRFGDGTFVSKYEEASINPIERPNVLWRVINDYDIVTHIPPGFADAEENRPSISALSVLNYAHIGAALRLSPFKKPYYNVDTSSLHSATRVVVVKDGAQGKPSESKLPSWFPVLVKLIKWWNPLSWVFAPVVYPVLLVTSVWNHFPASYWDHLKQIKVDGQGGEKRRAATAEKGSATKTGADKKSAEGVKKG